MKKMKILALGLTPCADNRGVSAITFGVIKVLIKAFRDCEIRIWHTFPESYHRKKMTVEIHRDFFIDRDSNVYVYFIRLFGITVFSLFYFLTRKLGFRCNLFSHHKIFKWYQNADLVVSCNFGDVFSDLYGIIPFLSLFSQNLISIMLGKRIVMFPQSIGPFNNLLTRKLAKFILKNSEIIFLREKNSYKYLKELDIDSSKVFFIPDLAFLLNKAADEVVNNLLIKEGVPETYLLNKKFVGISVNPALHKYSKTKKDEYFNIIRCFTDYITVEREFCVLFVPNVTFDKGYDTRSLADDIKKKCKNKDQIFSIKGDYTAQELKGIISRCDFFVGSLTHTLIASTSLCIPSLAISYSHKTKGIMDRVGMGDYVLDIRNMDVEQIIVKFNELCDKKGYLKLQLKENIASEKEKIWELINCIS